MELHEKLFKGRSGKEWLPFVSLVIPSYNEERFIGPLLDRLLSQDYPYDKLEILIADGRSSDKTRDIIRSYAEHCNFIRLLDNEKQYVPFALNLGIRAAKGELVIILGAHAEYPTDYVTKLVSASGSLKADLVGGLCIACPADQAVKSLAIAKALSCPFGVGFNTFRTGAASVKKVDTVAFGCYRRELFDKLGYFDESLIRNQDDEFSARIMRANGSIWLIPDIKVTYYTRSKVGEVIRMFYQYGLFKPLVSKKIGKSTSVRQLIPVSFLVFLAVSSLGFMFNRYFGFFLAGGLGLYLLTDLYFTLRLTAASSKRTIFLYLPWLFFMIHFSYGWGYLVGIFRFLVFNQEKRHIRSSR